jgi:hypothetical protein
MVGLRMVFIGSASLSPHNYRLHRSAQARCPAVIGGWIEPFQRKQHTPAAAGNGDVAT